MDTHALPKKLCYLGKLNDDDSMNDIINIYVAILYCIVNLGSINKPSCLVYAQDDTHWFWCASPLITLE